MKTTTALQLAAILYGTHPLVALPQFSSGSTGADGPLTVTTHTTLTVPPDGVFNFTTITVDNGAHLSFKRNALNTPVYLLATGDVVIGNGDSLITLGGGDASGLLAGESGPGGFDGGFGGDATFRSGDGQGPGGGRATPPFMWHAAFASTVANNTNIYGNTLLSPLIGGSGGAGWMDVLGSSGGGGGGGGGAILIASSTRITVGGRISANGGAGNGGGGSGGAIRLVAPIVDGVGTLQAIGGTGENGHQASVGRIRIDCVDRFAFRTLALEGKATRGARMFVFPETTPRLDIIEAAGSTIAERNPGPVAISLPLGSPTNQIVRVQARGFTNDVPVRVRMIPENGASVTTDFVIPQNSGNPPFVDVEVGLIPDVICYIQAWTR